MHKETVEEKMQYSIIDYYMMREIKIFPKSPSVFSFTHTLWCVTGNGDMSSTFSEESHGLLVLTKPIIFTNFTITLGSSTANLYWSK